MDVEVIVIGAGIVGLACARESARQGFSTLLIERHESFGQETSSRNSEVIHSGIYYDPGSWKARLCPAGNRTMYEDCRRLGVWHRRCGKLIVAVTAEEEPEIQKLYDRGITNGVENPSIIDTGQAAKMEPNIRCCSAIYLPSTGIVDSHELMKAYLHEASSLGADVAFGVEFVGMEDKKDGYRLALRERGGGAQKVTARFVVNSAGLGAEKVARSFGIDVDEAGYRMFPNRGHYYKVSPAKSRLVSRLVYPVPHPQEVGLGIHITVDKAGQCKLGPDAEYLNATPGDQWYNFDDSDARRQKFFNAARRYFPSLELQDLSPDQTGVRPKIQAPGTPARDLVIKEESDRGLPGVIDLIGIESPGLTSAAEIAREVVRQIADMK